MSGWRSISAAATSSEGEAGPVRMKAWQSLEVRLLLAIGALFGGMALLIVPPAVVYDGPSHFFRALQVSEGNFRSIQYSARSAGSALPKGQVEFTNTLWGQYWPGKSFGTPAAWAALSRRFAGDAEPERA